MLINVLDIDGRTAVGQRHKQWIDAHSGQQMEPALFEVPQARREAVAEERHEPKYVIGCAAGVDRMLRNCQARLMIEQAIKNMWRLAGCGGNNFRVERAVLVGKMSIEADARFVAMPRVYIGDRLAWSAGEEMLVVGTRLRAVAPDSR